MVSISLGGNGVLKASVLGEERPEDGKGERIEWRRGSKARPHPTVCEGDVLHSAS